MNTSPSKTYLENTLLYLKKDWAWSPILLEALKNNTLNDSMIEALSDMLSDVISLCKDDQQKIALIHLREKIKEHYTLESSEKQEAEGILISII